MTRDRTTVRFDEPLAQALDALVDRLRDAWTDNRRAAPKRNELICGAVAKAIDFARDKHGRDLEWWWYSQSHKPLSHYATPPRVVTDPADSEE